MAVKRFIAGAVCQRCGQTDKLRAWVDETRAVMHRECVACGHQDVIAMGETAEIETRVNYADPVFDEDVQPVRLILDPPPKQDA